MIEVRFVNSDHTKDYSIKFSFKWSWKGKYHKKPYSFDHSQYIDYFFGFITFSRNADMIDTIEYRLNNSSKELLTQFIEWYNVKTLWEILEDRKDPTMSDRRYKKYMKKYQSLV